MAYKELLGANRNNVAGDVCVDLQRWDSNKRHGHVQVSSEDDEVVDDFDIKVMANLIGMPLVDGTFCYYRTVNRPSACITTLTDTSSNPLT